MIRKPAPIADTGDSTSGDIKTLLRMLMALLHENYQRGVDLKIPAEFGELHQRVIGESLPQWVARRDDCASLWRNAA